MDIHTHVLQVEQKRFVVRFIDRRPDDAPLVDVFHSGEPLETLTENEFDTVNRWIRKSFDEYRPFIVSMPDGKEYFNP